MGIRIDEFADGSIVAWIGDEPYSVSRSNTGLWSFYDGDWFQAADTMNGLVEVMLEHNQLDPDEYVDALNIIYLEYDFDPEVN